MQEYVCAAHTHSGIYHLADRTIFKHRYPFRFICMSRREQILLYVNLPCHDIVWPASKMNISHLKQDRGIKMQK